MHASPEDIAHAVALLRSGRLVAFPTETVYGLGADATSAGAVREVFRVKGRPAGNPLIVHVADEAMARRVCAAWPARAAALVTAFWPGPLTLVLPKSDVIPPEVTAGGGTVGVRCPGHPLTLALIEAFGAPLVGPSANRSGGVSPTCAEHVREAFAPAEVFVLDGGPCLRGVESTVLDLTAEPARILRPGVVTAEEIAAVLRSEVATEHGSPSGGGPERSPGRMRSHYAPRAPVTLVEPGEVEEALAETGQAGAVVLTSEPRPALGHAVIAMPREAGAYAARLYAALREADALGPGRILVVRPWPAEGARGVWAAVADRLARAAAPRDEA